MLCDLASRSFTPEMKFEYDLANEADFAKLNIASGVEGSTVTEGIPDPYAVYHGLTVPEAVYTNPPPYDTSVVEIGEKVFGEPFHEYTAEEEGEAVMGKAYEGEPPIPVGCANMPWSSEFRSCLVAGAGCGERVLRQRVWGYRHHL